MKKNMSKTKPAPIGVRLVGSDKPWGKAQSVKEVGPGILSYSTALHGGYYLDPTTNAKVSQVLKKATFGELGLKGWYEEDCDWAIVVFTFKKCFAESHYKAAVESLERFHADSW